MKIYKDEVYLYNSFYRLAKKYIDLYDNYRVYKWNNVDLILRLKYEIGASRENSFS